MNKFNLQWFVGIVDQFLPVLFWVTLILGFEEPKIALLTVISAIIHESGHIVFLRIKGVKGVNPRGVISGFRIRSSTMLTYREEMLLYLFGPLANICVAAALCFIENETVSILCALNVATAISNLLPVEGYDGYGIIRTLAERQNPNGIAVRVLECVSTGTIFAFCILSIYFIDRFGSGYWFFGIFFFSMLRRLSKWLENTKLEN